MKVRKQQVETYVLTDLERLDPVTVYVTNYKLGQGKIVIECFGESWASYWGAMGSQTLQDFVISSENDYLANKLVKSTRQIDFDEINKIAHKRGRPDICVTSDVEVAMISNDMVECFGDDWYMDLPTRHTDEYKYVCRILNAVKAAFQEEKEQA